MSASHGVVEHSEAREVALPVGLNLRGSIAFGEREILSNFSLNLPAGEWSCLLGRSASGKTSILRAIAGLLPQPEFVGTIKTSDGMPLAGRLGWLAQADDLLPWETVAKNTSLGARLRGKRLAAERIEKALQAVGLESYAQCLPHILSGGQKQRVALARVLVEDSDIILLDEPFSKLDAITRMQMQQLAFELFHGRTVLHVTHDPLEAARLADHICLISDERKIISLSSKSSPIRKQNSDESILLQQQIMQNLGLKSC